MDKAALARSLQPRPNTNFFIPSLIKFLGTCGIRLSPAHPGMAVTAQRGENVLRQGSRKLSTASISNAGRINISFAICLHIRNVTPSNAAAKAIRRRPHPIPRDMPEDGAGAGEREQPRRKQFRRPQKPPLLLRLSPSTLDPPFLAFTLIICHAI